MSFRGTYDHNVDTKGRVSLPAKFRKELPDEVVIVPVPDEKLGNALYVFRDEDFNDWKMSFFMERDEQGDMVNTFDPKKQHHVDLVRYLDSKSSLVSIDGAGRIKLPGEQCEVVGIDKDVAIVGRDNYIEVWDARTFKTRMESVNPFASFMED